MCGIFAILNQYLGGKNIHASFIKGQPRGPETSNIKEFDLNVTLGFHRLAINGLTDKSNQPLQHNDCVLICNGEIYNHTKLAKLVGIQIHTESDCEIIIHLYKKFGMTHTLHLLDGVFAFVLYDMKLNRIFVARDQWGVRPLFSNTGNAIGVSWKDTDWAVQCCQTWMFASELKSLNNLCKNVEQFPPGTVSCFNIRNKEWYCLFDKRPFCTSYIFENPTIHKSNCSKLIKNALTNAVQKRVDNTERPIACLLSGGLDSSLITALVNQYMKPGQLETYSIGMEGSVDLFYAKKVADFLGTNHTEIIMTPGEFLKAIPETIYAIESYDTTTVRASVGNYLVAKYISENSDAKVIFNGDGSDEVCGGYLYFHYAPNCFEFDKECKKLLNNIHYFDVLRSDRSISSVGLEARTPFLDKNFVRTYLSIPAKYRCHKTNHREEKYLLRDAFKGILPDEVLFRTKEAFSDGVSSSKKSWFEMIQEHLSIIIFQEMKCMRNIAKTNEQKYYRTLFRKYFGERDEIIPYFWMPNFVKDATDASARTLDIYKKSTPNICPIEKKHAQNAKALG